MSSPEPARLRIASTLAGLVMLTMLVRTVLEGEWLLVAGLLTVTSLLGVREHEQERRRRDE